MSAATAPRWAHTGQEGERRPLTLEEAQAGATPDPFTELEWQRMHRSTQDYALELARRTAQQLNPPNIIYRRSLRAE